MSNEASSSTDAASSEEVSAAASSVSSSSSEGSLKSGGGFEVGTQLLEKHDLIQFGKCLKSKKIQPDDRDDAGNTLLHLASSQKGRGGFMKALLRAGADPNATNVLGSTPLHKAVSINNTVAIRILLQLESGQSVSSSSSSPVPSPSPSRSASSSPSPSRLASASPARSGSPSLLSSSASSPSSPSHASGPKADITIKNQAGLTPVQLSFRPDTRLLLLGDLGKQEFFPVPKEKMGAVIGPKFTKLESLMADSGALLVKIETPVSGFDIIGTAETVRSARDLIRKIIVPESEDHLAFLDDRSPETAQFSARYNFKKPVAFTNIYALEGRYVRELQAHEGVRVTREADTNTVVIEGHTEASVAAALKAILDFSQKKYPAAPPKAGSSKKGPSRSSSSGAASSSSSSSSSPKAAKHVAPFSLPMKVEKRRHGLIIGPGGQTIVPIQTKYNVRFDIPPRESPSEIITIYGESEETLQKVKAEIDGLLAGQEHSKK